MNLTETERVLQLIDFLDAFAARKNPPVRAIAGYGQFCLREDEMPIARGVMLTPGAATWISIDFVDLPDCPELPVGLEELLGPATKIGPFEPPRATDPGAGEGEVSAERIRHAQDWVEEFWQPWSVAHAEGS